jgi:PAS domain S-box-containing protein
VIVVGLFDYDNDNDSVPGVSVTTSAPIAPDAPSALARPPARWYGPGPIEPRTHPMPTAAAPPGPPPPLHDLRTLQAVMPDRTILIGAAMLLVSGAIGFYLNVLLSVLFLSPRAGWFNVALGALVLAVIGAAAVGGWLTFPIDYPNFVKTPAVWVQTVFSFIAFSAFTAVIAARLPHSLDATVQALATQTAALRETQAQLRTALDQQRAIFNHSSAGIALIDGTRTIVAVNPRFCALLGYRAADLIGQSTRLLHRDAAAFEAVAARCYAPPGPAGAYSEDIQLRRRDGTLLWTHASLSPLDPAAPEAGAVLVLVDIDQRKRIELALAFAKQQAESATRAKSRFLATVTHELRTPLHAILGFAEVIGRLEAQAGEPDGDHPGAPHAEAAERRRDLLATIRRNGRQLLSLIDEVLDFSRLERGRLSLRALPTALPALLRDCVGEAHWPRPRGWHCTWTPTPGCRPASGWTGAGCGRS